MKINMKEWQNVIGFIKRQTKMKKWKDATSFSFSNSKIKVIKKGDIQLTTEYRHNLREQKRRQILDIIHKNGVDPKTHLPHPLTRLENAFEEAKVKIDDRREPMEQVSEILKKLQLILPIRFERKQISVRIPTQYAGKAYGTVKTIANVLHETWENDGSWKARIEFPGGMQNEVLDKLNSLTHGNVEIDILKIEEA